MAANRFLNSISSESAVSAASTYWAPTVYMHWRTVAFPGARMKCKVINSHPHPSSPTPATETFYSADIWFCPCLRDFSLAVSPAWHAFPSPQPQRAPSREIFLWVSIYCCQPSPITLQPMAPFYLPHILITSWNYHIYLLIGLLSVSPPLRMSAPWGQELLCWVPSSHKMPGT